MTRSKEHGNERNGSRLMMLVVRRSVPLRKNVFGSTKNPGPHQLDQHERYFFAHTHATTPTRGLLCANWCPRPLGGVHLHQAIRYLFPFGWAVGEKGGLHFFFLFQDTCICIVLYQVLLLFLLPSDNVQHIFNMDGIVFPGLH